MKRLTKQQIAWSVARMRKCETSETCDGWQSRTVSREKERGGTSRHSFFAVQSEVSRQEAESSLLRQEVSES